MELTYKKIPPEFLGALPEGIKFVNKHGRDFLIVYDLRCPRGHSLMADSVKIHGEPAIKIKADTGASSGLIFVDAFWGGHEKLYAFLPVLNEEHPVMRVSCPECGADMTVTRPCGQTDCASDKHIQFYLPGGKNKISVCARLGCPGHHMDITDVPNQVSESVDEINYFGSFDDDIFQGI